MNKLKVLFICVHNSARSQMAEAFLKSAAGDRFEVESAGLEPTEINPLVVDVMKELDFDLSHNQTKSVFEFYKKGRLFDYIITVCDEAVEERCPIYPGVTKRLHWPFPDPSALTGTREQKLVETRKIRDQIRSKIEQFASNL